MTQLSACPPFRLRLLQPEPHVHLSEHGDGGREMLFTLLSSTGAQVHLAKAQVAVRDQWPHAAVTSQFQRTTIVVLTALGIEQRRLRGDITEEVQLIRAGAGLERASCHLPRVVEPAELESGPAQTPVAPCRIEPLRFGRLEKLQALEVPG